MVSGCCCPRQLQVGLSSAHGVCVHAVIHSHGGFWLPFLVLCGFNMVLTTVATFLVAKVEVCGGLPAPRVTCSVAPC